MSDPTTFSLLVQGPLACFTNPAGGKVERFTYPCITPSASRAIFEAILWKRDDDKQPVFRWEVTQVDVYQPPRYLALRRNELKSVSPAERTIKSWMLGKTEPQPIIAEEDHTQRQTIALKNVKYRLHARMVPYPGQETALPKMAAMFQRRASRGQCVAQPYLGCREFPADFEPAPDDMEQPPDDLDIPIGWMLYDVFDTRTPGGKHDSPAISVFDAHVKGGVLRVPPPESDQVIRAERRDA